MRKILFFDELDKAKYLQCRNERDKGNKNTHYVYGHYLKDSPIPFYVGSGCNTRCISNVFRSAAWREIRKDNQIYVRIFDYMLSQEQADEFELMLIKKFDDELINHQLYNRTITKSDLNKLLLEPLRLYLVTAPLTDDNTYRGFVIAANSFKDAVYHNPHGDYYGFTNNFNLNGQWVNDPCVAFATPIGTTEVLKHGDIVLTDYCYKKETHESKSS